MFIYIKMIVYQSSLLILRSTYIAIKMVILWKELSRMDQKRVVLGSVSDTA